VVVPGFLSQHRKTCQAFSFQENEEGFFIHHALHFLLETECDSRKGIRPFNTKQFKWKKKGGQWGESFILTGEKTVF